MQSRLSSYFARESSCSELESESSSSLSTTSDSSATTSGFPTTSKNSSSIVSSAEPIATSSISLDPADYFRVKFAALSREEKHRLVSLGPCQPRLRNYPIYQHDGHKRSFQSKWFNLVHARDWLEYSCKANKMFCFACRIFGMPGSEKGEENLISKGVTGAHWKNAVKRIFDHALTQYHVSSTDALKTYLQGDPIDCQLDKQRAADLSKRQAEIVQNRTVLSHILDIIKFLAKQNLPFRGHNESSDSANKENFLELVHHQAKYDLVLQQHLQKVGRNSTYLSPDIQNQFIQAMADQVLFEISRQVKEAKFFLC